MLANFFSVLCTAAVLMCCSVFMIVRLSAAIFVSSWLSGWFGAAFSFSAGRFGWLSTLGSFAVEFPFLVEFSRRIFRCQVVGRLSGVGLCSFFGELGNVFR